MPFDNTIPRWLAIREAGHAVARYRQGGATPEEAGIFDRVLVRSEAQWRRAPIRNRRGTRLYVDGLVDGPFLYQSTSFVLDRVGRGGPVYVPDMWRASKSTSDEASKLVDTEKLIDVLRDCMEREVIVELSGTIAQYKHERRWVEHFRRDIKKAISGKRNDRTRYAVLAAHDFARTPEDCKAILMTLFERSMKFVDDPANWRAICALATALQEHRKLDYEDAAEIIVGAYRMHERSSNHLREQEKLLPAATT